jgi:hypothetical protein
LDALADPSVDLILDPTTDCGGGSDRLGELVAMDKPINRGLAEASLRGNVRDFEESHWLSPTVAIKLKSEVFQNSGEP